MFLLFEVAGQGLILGIVPETLEVLIFGLALVLLAIGLRWLMKRADKNANGDIKHITK
jgi:hypothetical protein